MRVAAFGLLLHLAGAGAAAAAGQPESMSRAELIREVRALRHQQRILAIRVLILKETLESAMQLLRDPRSIEALAIMQELVTDVWAACPELGHEVCQVVPCE